MLVNYTTERVWLESVFASECDCRILALGGDVGMGKSSLLLQLATSQRNEVYCATVDLELINSIPELIHRLCRGIGWGRLTQLRAILARIYGREVRMSDIRVLGWGNSVSAAVAPAGAVDLEHQTAAISDAFVDDLQSLDRPAVLMIDSFDAASSTIRNWIEGNLLSRVAQATNVRVIVAGTSLPPIHNIEYGHCCTEQLLRGVPNASDWLPYIKERKKKVPKDIADHPSYIQGICDGSYGNPMRIATFIQGLPGHDE